MQWIGVGPRFLAILVAIVLGVGWISWTMIQYGAGKEAQKILLEQNQNYTNVRKKVDVATKTNPSSDAAIAREWLLKRQQGPK